ncbi:hypothetical protein C2E23DRAFT_853875 [Lenzites betulinus]|nr:hypothetical protein C2E23DRAFT_853875 [Lenzites betulinus]
MTENDRITQTTSSPVSEPVPSRAPSRAGHRWPPLVRTASSPDLCRGLSPIKLMSQALGLVDNECEEDDSSKTLPATLPPLCPPSPISSSSSASGSDLDSPTSSSEDLHEYEDEDVSALDGFPLPPSTYSPPALEPLPAPTPAPVDCDASSAHPTVFHHGLSRSALSACRDFWDRRFRFWLSWRAHVDRLDALQAAYAADHVPAPALRYPSPPTLPRTRDIPGHPTNGRVPSLVPPPDNADDFLGACGRRTRLPVYNPYAPIFPRLGDLRTLREPYCDWHDRAFVFYPTYAIAKTLYAHDMGVREEEWRCRGMYAPEDAALCVNAKPWEVDWNARWQILVDRQPYPPQPYPPPPGSSPAHEDAQLDASLEQRADGDGENVFAWTPEPEADGAFEHAFGESPLTRLELDAGTPDAMEPPLVQGWCTGQSAPVVRLPGGPVPTRPRRPSACELLADEIARIALASGGEDEGEQGAVEEELEDVPPPRPASPALRFFFVGSDSEDSDGEDCGFPPGAVLSVQSVSC